ncbi:hypothetical protein ACMGDK_18835 [Chryseobacterium sp. DT-3]|uniref:hypothetical protein n=1 Tax=Chryseobacterium sp. DT-3 TaxID=3396164 RepID=UPI003F1E3AFE
MKKIDEKPIMYFFRHPYFMVYLEEYITDQVNKMLFRKIISVERELKYIIEKELKEKYLVENISFYQSYDFSIFKMYLKFSIDYIERDVIMDQGWLLQTIEEYNSNFTELFSIIPHPDAIYAADAYNFIRLTEEEDMYEKFNKCKDGYVEVLIDFLFYSYLIEKLESLTKASINYQDYQEHVNIKQKQKIGLLIQSGIVDFLREKYPKLTNNQIAGFFELISQEPLKQKSTNTHFTQDKNSSKYPIQNMQDKRELSLILAKYGMKNN